MPHQHLSRPIASVLATFLLTTGLSLNTTLKAETQGASLSAQAPQSTQEVKAYGRFAPEREDDFAWENDKIAFRIYGPSSNGKGAISGVDAWFKKVDYSIIDKWYAEHLSGKSYHEDHGEGLDIYHTGNSRGVGGTAIWLDGKAYPAAAFSDWKIVEKSKDSFAFQVNYTWTTPLGEIKEQKTIAIKTGSQFYQVDSQFLLDGKKTQLPIAVGLATHDGKASTDYNMEQGWIATWEAFQNHHVGTGAFLAKPEALNEVVVNHSKVKDASHAWLVTQTDTEGRLQYSAGFAWTAAKEIINKDGWLEHLNKSTMAK